VKLKITSPGLGELLADTTDENPRTVEKIRAALPLEGTAKTWGDEVYFDVDVSVEPENAREVVDEGEIGFWLEQPCICLFFGKTPVSGEGEIRAYSPVNVFAKMHGDLNRLREIKQGEVVRIEAAP
jgi:hypothetical protein